jgi:hypothetical protein
MYSKMFFAIAFLLFFYSASSQTVIGRLTKFRNIHWDAESEEYHRDSLRSKFTSYNPKVILAFDEIIFIDNDTSRVVFNSAVEEREDSIAVIRIWHDASDENWNKCSVYLYYFKEDDNYGLRVLYDDNTGIEYFLTPLKVDAIPYKKSLSVSSSN